MPSKPEMFIQDLRYAFRGLLRRPGFTAVAVITLSLGIGATTAIFSVVQAVLLRPLEYQASDRLLKIRGFDKKDGTVGNLSPGDFMDFARDAKTLEHAGANGFVGLFTVGGGVGEAERVGGVNVTAGFFSTLGVQPALGRLFDSADDTPTAETMVVLSDGFWRRRFGADPGIVGKAIALNARPATVIGVLPPSYRHLEINPERPADVFAAFGFDPAQPNRGGHFIRAVARLKDGVSIEQARAELESIAARLEQQFPKSNINLGVKVEPLLESMVSESRPVILLLSAAVIVVLLVACANVANLLLAHGTGRLRELALRAAIGADRKQLVRQMLTESTALSLLGAAGGLLVAFAATRALTALAATGIPRADQIGLNGGVLAFALIAAVATSVVFGLMPALHLSKQDLNDALKEGGRSQGTSIGRGARELLIVAEVAMSIVLLVGAGLLIRSLWQLQEVNPGFTTDKVLAMEVSLPTARYKEGEQMPFYQRLEERIGAKPGVAAVGAINILPLSANYDSRGIQVEDQPKPEGQGYAPQARSVTPGYFAAMGIPLLAGRNFDAHDLDEGQLVVVVSEAMARKYWPGEPNVIGKRITFNSGIPTEKQQVVGGPGSRVVIGVAGNVKHLGLDEDEVPMFYTPHTQQPSYHTMRVVVRADAEPAALTRMVREELTQMDREVPLSQVTTLSRALDATVAAPRMRANLLGLFAALAMILAAIGVYGVVAYMVGQRTQEIGVRRALGAKAMDVMMMLMREAMRPVAIGIVIGIAGAYAMTRLLAAMLFGISATDVTTYLIACAVLGIAALLASIVPARRALAVDPITAVRGQ
ncbi:MAG TPA: ABC transporter permease [Vicinamibacterales bacterium]|nr:ABC transporter permease [Vicinamibacterales bacterium]